MRWPVMASIAAIEATGSRLLGVSTLLGCGEKMVLAVAVSLGDRPNNFPTNCRITTLEGFKLEPFNGIMELHGRKLPFPQNLDDRCGLL